MSQHALECGDVSVLFGEVAALQQVSLGFEAGRIHAVVGQNGAGKTTFARVCAGIVRPSSGQLLIGGTPVPLGKVNAARAAGVELVHQSFALPPSFTVAEAMEFGAQGRGALFSASSLKARWAGHLKGLGVEVDPRARIRDLPVETRQAVEIARALVSDARILILDEPTAVLSPSGIDTLFERLRGLRDSGVTIILILHKIREVLGIAETVSVLRGGRLIEAGVPASQIDATRLANAIIGTAASLDKADKAALVGEGASAPAAHAAARPATAPVLDMKDLNTRPDSEGRPLERANLAIRSGEIVGIAGVEGNGQQTLVRALAGLVGLERGSIALDGRDVTRRPLLERRAAGLRIIPFDRNAEGLSLTSSLWENWAARSLLLGRILSFVAPTRLRKACHSSLQGWDVRFATTAQPAGSLSGGNAQKVILAREIDETARLVIAAQPTRGLDIGATAFVWRALRASRDKGCGVLLISSDLDELFDIADRVVVMFSGRIVAEFTAPFDIAAVGQAMVGDVSLEQAA
ncbi:ABC transporter ATP-binding protein [Labrys neptuniae]